MSILDKIISRRALEARCADLEVRCKQLHDENTQLKATIRNLTNDEEIKQIDARLNERVANLKVALESLLKLYQKNSGYADWEDQSVVRTAGAILKADNEG